MKTEARILVVENSSTQAAQLSCMLERCGYGVSVARNGREALELLSRMIPDIVISEVVMSEMDGYELSRRIKGEARLAGVPIILLTALSDPTDIIRGLECGADNFFTKPYKEDYLVSRVQYLLANRHLRAEESARMGLEIYFRGRRHFITADRLQILNLLLSAYETTVLKNAELSGARDELNRLNNELEARVRSRTLALTAEVAERQRAEAEIRRLAEELENRVLERTAELDAANRELGSFSYSVSHDLRAPLRAIAGFCRVLEEESGGAVPEGAAHALGRIVENVRKMDVLIENLLAFSRLGSKPVHLRPVDMTDLARKALADLSGESADRRIEIAIGELAPGHADPVLFREVWMNLLSNALKFTRKRETGRIVVGSRIEGREIVYYVKDNGVGFDMRHADKLFGVFQRLHSSAEYPGTGVGLSLVQRIVHRHGGRVWAEAAPGEGATFFFSIRNEAERENAPAAAVEHPS